MNATSVSPVKPPLNPGNHAVPATATNLTKPPLPQTNSFSPLNLIPEAKPVVPVAISASPEKSVDLCSKPPPTSNGTVFPIPETNVNACSIISKNCVENCETAENLSTNNIQKSVEPASVDPKVTSEVFEEKKTEIKKVIVPVNDNLDPEKDTPAQVEPVKEVPSFTDHIPVKEDKNEPPTVALTTETIPNNVDASPAKKEPAPETAKAETSPVPEKKCKPDDSVKEIDEDKETGEAQSDEVPKPLTPKTVKRKAKPPVEEPVEEDSADGRKSKRVRLPTQPYQSPIPEFQFITKLNPPVKSTPKISTDRIIAFYKNEFLAVRNPEGSFYICQTFQNVHKNSTKIKIRWFTHLPQDIFTPDFYDTTEFDCILTNVTMTRVEKDRWKLPDQERTRIENILKRALDVEKGVVEQPSVTEEHPDGLDLSLFKDEAQLKKQKKKKSSSPKKKTAAKTPEKKKQMAKVTPKSDKTVASTMPLSSGTKKSSRLSSLNQSAAAAKESAEKTKTVEPKAKKDKKDKKKKKGKSSKKSAPSSKQTEKNTSKTWEPSVKASNSSRVVLSLKKEDVTKSSLTTETKTTTKRTSNVSLKASSTAAPSLPPQKRRKEEPKPSVTSSQPTAAERPGKVRNAGSAVTAKINSAAMRTTKDKERKTSASSNQRKK